MVELIIPLLTETILILVITWIIERFAFKKLSPNTRAFFTTASATALVASLDFVAPDFIGYNNNLIILLPSAVLVFLWRRHGYRRNWVEDERFADDFA